MEDREIIGLLFKRDERALAEISSKYGKYCQVIAENILSDSRTAEECVNDTLMRAWNSIPPANPDVLKLFLARITRNLAIDRLRSERSLSRCGVSEVLDELSGISSSIIFRDISDIVESEEFSEKLGIFLRSLPKRNCDIFVLRYFYSESTENISKKFGMSVDGVHKVLSRTRRKLKKFLEKEGYKI